MKRTILALALLMALVLPGMAKAEGTGMYLAPKFLMTIQETGTIERSGMGGVDEYSQFTLGGALAAGYDFWPQYLVPLRVELEYALRGNSEKSWGSNWGSCLLYTSQLQEHRGQHLHAELRVQVLVPFPGRSSGAVRGAAPFFVSAAQTI